ncbi:MAG: type II toxin-antitoxin system death-on-curing family toxin [Verrucomicrobia subdivision 3 bacterium]|nr:type II toxin-antitoxin system death-on-curing family toxin [Limisphaerales bacterium]
MEEPIFLSREEILAYHVQQIELYGGDAGLRDAGLLDSAIAQPQNTYLYNPTADLYDIAAAYAFHIAKNHPFTDGNKRTGLHAGLGFLRVNGIRIIVAPASLYDAMIRLATSSEGKSEFAHFLRTHGESV